MTIQTHKGDGVFGVRIEQIGGQFGILARASDMLMALETMPDDTGILIERTGTIVAGGPITQSGTKALQPTPTGYVLMFNAGDRAGDVKDAIRIALETNVITPDCIVALPAKGMMTFIDPSTIHIEHFCFVNDRPTRLMPYILDWPLRLRR